MTLTEFLLARINEDEDAARAVNGARWNSQVTLLSTDLYGHVIRQHPDRILAECDAKRKILELHASDEHECVEMHRGVYSADWPEGTYAKAGEAWAHPSLELHIGPCPTLLHLAAVYADHPDYNPEWA